MVKDSRKDKRETRAPKATLRREPEIVRIHRRRSVGATVGEHEMFERAEVDTRIKS